MATTPFQLPRQTRETAILTGNGTAGPYGPSLFKVFDVADVRVYQRPAGTDEWQDMTGLAAVAKTAALPFDTFSVTFPAAVAPTTDIIFRSERVSERSIAVTRAGTIDSVQLEKELSKQASVQQELRRDVDQAVRAPFGQEASALADAIAAIGPISSQIVTVSGVAPHLAPLAGLAGELTAVAGVASSIPAVAGNAAAIAAIAASLAEILQADDNAAQTAADRAQTGLDLAAVANYLIQAQAARDATLAAFDQFDDRYLGAMAADPATDNDGDALTSGLLYFNSTSGAMKVYTGALWVAAYVSGTDFAALSNNGSDYNAALFRNNLSLYSQTEIDAFAVKLTGDQAIAGIKTFSSAPAVPDASWPLAKLANGSAVSVVGRPANSAGPLAAIAAGANDRLLARVGDALAWVEITIGMIPDGLITAAKVAANTFQPYDAQLSSLVRQNSQSAAYTLALTDGGKHILHPSADTTARTWTIPENASVAFPVGTAITFVNQNGAGVITIAITSDTLRWSPSGGTGSRTLAPNGIATAIKITASIWLISGTGLT